MHRVAQSVGDTATLTHRADLYVFNCTRPDYGCLLDTPLATIASPQTFEIRWPKPGEWRVVVDPVRAIDGPVVYTLTIATN